MAATQQDSAGTSARRALRVGVLGIGVSGARVARAMSTMPETELVAAGDTREKVQYDFNERYGTPVYGSAEELCADPNVEALWISTPNQFHAEHAILAAQHGKHIIIEKPIAISMAEAERMLDAVEANGVTMVCGHTQSYTPRARKVLAILRSGELGRLCAMNVWAYTDWMLRPRTAVDLDPAQGGGIPYRQAPHQVDTLRILGGGMVRSVRGMTGQWMPERTIPGYYSAYMEFEDGTPVTLLHNGYGFFNTAELAPWESERSNATPESRGEIRKGLRSGTWDEEAAKQERYLGGRRETEEADREGGERPWVAGRPGHAGSELRARRHPLLAARPVRLRRGRPPRGTRDAAQHHGARRTDGALQRSRLGPAGLPLGPVGRRNPGGLPRNHGVSPRAQGGLPPPPSSNAGTLRLARRGATRGRKSRRWLPHDGTSSLNIIVPASP